jgi:hypothetical protein
MGVGNFQFSRDEQERKQQMDFFREIEKEVRIVIYLLLIITLRKLACSIEGLSV